MGSEPRVGGPAALRHREGALVRAQPPAEPTSLVSEDAFPQHASIPRKLKAVFFDLNDTLHDDGGEQFIADLERTCEQFGDQVGILPSAWWRRILR